MAEFDLSSKAIIDHSNNPIPEYYWGKDVKEFIKLLKDWYDNEKDQRSLEQFLIDEAGKELSNG